MTDLESILKRHEKAKNLRDLMASTWREISDYVRPLKQNIGENGTLSDFPDQARLAQLFDTSAVYANQTYAAGCMSWMTPSESVWFAYDAPNWLEGDDSVKSWYSKCTDIAVEEMARSNFYQQIHEAYLDDGAFGTSGLIIEEGDNVLRFEALNIGDYAILENSNREVDTLFRIFRLTPRQAQQKFGLAALHPDVQQCIAGGKKEDLDKDEEYLHAILPNEGAQQGKLDISGMPYASVFIDLKRKHIVRESGAWEKPFAVNRHLLWSHLPYGFSPGMLVLADCRQLNVMQQYLDTLVEKQVSPPVLAPASFEGRIDLRAGGVTSYPTGDGNKPTFWPNPGNYMVSEDRTLFRKDQINKAFHVDLFQALSAVPPGKEMTAEEIRMRQRDRLTLFSPTFARKNTELNTPVMRRVFAILLRAGAFPSPPPSLIQMAEVNGGMIPDPEVTYTSRLALQIKAIKNEAVMRVMAFAEPLAAANPEVLDNVNFDELFRLLSRNEGFPEDALRPERDVSAIRQQRAESQAQAEEEARQLEEADAVAKLT